MSVSINRVRELATEARSAYRDPVNNCGMINRSVQLALEQDENVRVRFVEAGTISANGNSALHHFLVIPHDEVEGTSSAVVVDCALDQFTTANSESDEVDVDLDLESASDRPLARVGVFTANDHEYQWYEF